MRSEKHLSPALSPLLRRAERGKEQQQWERRSIRVRLLPILDVFVGDGAAALAFAGILEFAGVVAGFAAAEALAIIAPAAILNFRSFPGGRFLAGRRRGAAFVGGIVSV